MALPGSMYKLVGRRYVDSQAVYNLAGAHDVIALADGGRVMDKLLPRWRAKLPSRFSQDFIDGFITRNRGALEAVVARAVMLRGVKRGASPETPEALVAYGRLVERERPKDAELTAEDLQGIAQYSGWGGLSIESVKAMLPADLVPESFGLINEYYTPTVIAESIPELLSPRPPELIGNDGIVRALEPSAGIGRLIRAFSPRRWVDAKVKAQALHDAGRPGNESDGSVAEKEESTMKPEKKAEPRSPTPEPAPPSKAEAEQDKELMGSFTSELDAVLDEDEDD